jgi:hypothetical protein
MKFLGTRIFDNTNYSTSEIGGCSGLSSLTMLVIVQHKETMILAVLNIPGRGGNSNFQNIFSTMYIKSPCKPDPLSVFLVIYTNSIQFVIIHVLAQQP